MGDAVGCKGFIYPKYYVDEQLKKFVEIGGEILACGTCLKSGQLDSTEACPWLIAWSWWFGPKNSNILAWVSLCNKSDQTI